MDHVQNTVLRPLGMEKFTETQALALPTLFAENARSVLVRAPTGSGKTLCYLLATLKQLGDDPRFRVDTEREERAQEISRDENARSGSTTTCSSEEVEVELSAGTSVGVRALIIAPSRELALQISSEAEKVVGSSKAICCLVGGVRSRKQDCGELKKRRPDIVVATPGRLIDHFEQTLFFHDLFKHLQVVVLDEADRLCEMAFLEDLKRVLSYINSAATGTGGGAASAASGEAAVRPSTSYLRYLLFSATLPRRLESNVIARYIDSSILRVECGLQNRSEAADAGDEIGRTPCAGGYDRNGVVLAGEASSGDPAEGQPRAEAGNVQAYGTSKAGQQEQFLTPKMSQTAEILPAESMLAALRYRLAAELRANPTSYRVLVFFPTARMTQFFAAFFRELLRFPVLEIHSRKDAHQRLRVSSEFAKGRAGILFSSDVSARGMDYPDVTLVLQFCAPHSFDQYVHRIGRTARAGKTGRAHLLLSHFEQKFADLLRGAAEQGAEDVSSAAGTRSNADGHGTYAAEQSDAFAAGRARTKPPRNIDNSLDHGAVKFLDNSRTAYYSEALNAATMAWQSSTSMNSLAAAAFVSLLGHFKLYTNVLSLNEDQVVQVATLILTGCGMVQTPVISRELAENLGLAEHPGLKIANDLAAGSVPEELLDPCLRMPGAGKRGGGGRSGGRGGHGRRKMFL
eukprot:g5703.t1